MLSVKNLRISLKQGKNLTPIVKDISFELSKGSSLGVVGESGCGKSLLCHSLMGLLVNKSFEVGGEVSFNGRNLLDLSQRDLLRIRGQEISMIFQDPMASLNPIVKVGYQVAEPLDIHSNKTSKQTKQVVLETLERVQLKEPEAVYHKYPFELSGGMQQRVMIAQALITSPKLLIADEPTTALDVTVQSEILSLMRDLRDDLDMSLLIVSHNFSMITHFCRDIMVMYAGQIAETIPSQDFHSGSLHPYTRALIGSIPMIGLAEQKLETLPGVVPLPQDYPAKCRFHNRCPKALETCEVEDTFVYRKGSHTVACNLLKNK